MEFGLGSFLRTRSFVDRTIHRSGLDFDTSGVLRPKFVELISIAFDAAITHVYALGTRRHIKAALGLGASAAEIMTVLKLCVAQGANALDAGVPILAEELGARGRMAKSDDQ
jgi:alkylhydroperoxidase/carboxymuconolactone decarboxylase family protein YurZ